eukprot:gene22481-8972_t
MASNKTELCHSVVGVEMADSASLICIKTKIRYEGLIDVNSKKTVALRDFKDFGTEGRKKEMGIPEEEVQRSHKLYKYISFKRSDIEDFSVFDTYDLRGEGQKAQSSHDRRGPSRQQSNHNDRDNPRDQQGPTRGRMKTSTRDCHYGRSLRDHRNNRDDCRR